MRVIDLQANPPPVAWGVGVDDDAIAELAQQWANDPFELPRFDYPGTPSDRDESWWFDYVTVAVSVLACLWPPPGHRVWRTEHEGRWLDDAPGIFAAFSRLIQLGQEPNDGFGVTMDLHRLAVISDDQGANIFAGKGTLQFVPERVQTIRDVATCLIENWSGSALNLVEEAGRDGTAIAELLTNTVPGFHDRPASGDGVLPFDKLSYLAAALMAAGTGWAQAGFSNYDDFPVYPDYMLPLVFRHFDVMVYEPALAAEVDGRRLIAADSEWEHAIRWATVYAGHRLRSHLTAVGAVVAAPALDYRLWSEAVLGPHAGSFGEHHRTLTLRY